MNSSCPFCSPNVEKAKFAQSENFIAIYNIAPILPGHVLIISKQHINKFMEVNDKHMTELIKFSRQIIRTLSKAFKTDSFNWTLQEGTAAGQTIEHMHIHIIPRQKNDLPEPGDWYPKLNALETEIIDSLHRPRHNDAEMESIVNYLQKIHQTSS